MDINNDGYKFYFGHLNIIVCSEMDINNDGYKFCFGHLNIIVCSEII